MPSKNKQLIKPNISIFIPISTTHLFTTKKIAVVSVINDLVTDNRVNKTCLTLVECGYEVILIGRKLPNSLPLLKLLYKGIRMRLLFKKGPLFYLFFTIRLFLKLLVTKTDVLYANDLDTLLPNFLVARLKKIPLIYDSHELFCEVPELLQSPFKRNIWLQIEKRIVPKLDFCITVNQSIAKIFEQKYHVPFHVVRNMSDSEKPPHLKSKQELNLPIDRKIILLQGAGINMDRGAEELVQAMCFVNNAFLLIIGGGDSWPVLKQKVVDLNLNAKVKLIDKIPKNDLMHYTYLADVGISIDKNTNLNYYNSLPNKIFDYLNAGVPILASRLPEVERIIKHYNVGDFIENHQPDTIAAMLNELLASDRLQQYKANTLKAKNELSWDIEKQRLIKVVQSVKY
jgi:glycosyltransferase involved in cell wall biosynthesis